MNATGELGKGEATTLKTVQSRFLFYIEDNNIQTKMSAFQLGESMPINPKQCQNLKFFERKDKISAKS